MLITINQYKPVIFPINHYYEPLSTIIINHNSPVISLNYS